MFSPCKSSGSLFMACAKKGVISLTLGFVNYKVFMHKLSYNCIMKWSYIVLRHVNISKDKFILLCTFWIYFNLDTNDLIINNNSHNQARIDLIKNLSVRSQSVCVIIRKEATCDIEIMSDKLTFWLFGEKNSATKLITVWYIFLVIST